MTTGSVPSFVLDDLKEWGYKQHQIDAMSYKRHAHNVFVPPKLNDKFRTSFHEFCASNCHKYFQHPALFQLHYLLIDFVRGNPGSDVIPEFDNPYIKKFNNTIADVRTLRLTEFTDIIDHRYSTRVVKWDIVVRFAVSGRIRLREKEGYDIRVSLWDKMITSFPHKIGRTVLDVDGIDLLIDYHLDCSTPNAQAFKHIREVDFWVGGLVSDAYKGFLV